MLSARFRGIFSTTFTANLVSTDDGSDDEEEEDDDDVGKNDDWECKYEDGNIISWKWVESLCRWFGFIGTDDDDVVLLVDSWENSFAR